MTDRLGTGSHLARGCMGGYTYILQYLTRPELHSYGMHPAFHNLFLWMKILLVFANMFLDVFVVFHDIVYAGVNKIYILPYLPLPVDSYKLCTL